MSSIMRQKIVFCGLPVSVGAKHLAIAPGARHEDVLRPIHEFAVSFARRERAPYIVFKEFGAGDCPTMDFLHQLGYRRFSSPAINTFGRRFSDMDSYVSALRSRYRQCVRKSLSKSLAANLRYERLTDTGAILRRYTHVAPRALRGGRPFLSAPPSSSYPFHFSTAWHAALAWPGSALTLAYAGDRVVAFNWNLFDEKVYHIHFAGLNYALNPSVDLYFNLMYAEMDCAFRAGADALVFGQTADDFKVRLGCSQEPRFFYMAPASLIGSVVLKTAGNFLLPEPRQPAIHHVFRDSERLWCDRMSSDREAFASASGV